MYRLDVEQRARVRLEEEKSELAARLSTLTRLLVSHDGRALTPGGIQVGAGGGGLAQSVGKAHGVGGKRFRPLLAALHHHEATHS